ncbi:MAG: Uncharcterized ATPase [uncultured bacterium]|nr:MAG: Uncharcterized ATPase [uncultured bacterium]OGT32354.1 MAG: hypothetical protein A3C44_06830 [Gammaproteobacteria bacterium RIFCSPHIGHO2_02_FULL_39_13]OGT48148.1 MAG: hypothetical protein A3E53_03040 [Gammaproteobacteria bacterium RIFCSPHIGHO2_12_FULL_39_24]
MNRYINSHVIKDLKKKMVFIGGPRQVGKTTLSKSVAEIINRKYEILRQDKNPTKLLTYFNWDVDEDRIDMLKKQWDKKASLITFDELHKYPHWKRWIKGVYDIRPAHQNYLVTGSAKLDTYKRGGDSLMGRYHYWRLHPFTLDELPENIDKNDAYQRLLTVGGFPEPFLQHDEREARRWRRERMDRILREDVRDLEQIKQLPLLDLLLKALCTRVGHMITYSNLAIDLQVAPNTVKNWLNVIERMYIAFSIKPYTKKIARAIQKPPKVYFYDNTDVMDAQGPRLENLVATHLLKRLNFIEDYFGHRCSLHYIRDKDGREVDFVTVIDDVVYDLIEVKESDSTISTSLKYYKKLLNPKRTTQLVSNLNRTFDQDGIRVTTPIEFFVNAPWETLTI